MSAAPAAPVSGLESMLFELRPRLLRFFSSRGRSWAADELADDVILRVLQKLRSGLAVESLAGFTLGVARLVWLEHLRSPASKSDPLPDDFEGQRFTTADDAPGMACLEQALAQLPAAARAVVLRFYGAAADDKKNKEARKRLAEELGITMNALFLRVSKLRRQLEALIRDCLGQGQVSGAGRTNRE